MSDEMDEIWALYADDGAQALDAMEIALDALGAGPAAATDPEVAAFFRAVHTFKGNSRVLGLAVVESRAHYAEDLIGLVRDQGVPWDAEIRDILLMAADTLRVMLEETAATRADVDPTASEPLMHRLKDKIARCTGAAPEPAVAEVAVAASEPVAVVAPTPQPEPEPAPAPRKAKARKAAEAPPVVTETPPAPAPAAERAPQPAPPPAKKPAGTPRLADDPTYRAIFQGMARDCLTKLRQATGSFGADPDAARTLARREADGLCHAARQMGLDDWEAALAEYLADGDGGIEAMAQLVLHLEELTEAEAGGARAASVADGGDDVSFLTPCVTRWIASPATAPTLPVVIRQTRMMLPKRSRQLKPFPNRKASCA